MIPLGDFIPLVRAAIPRFQRFPPNARQEACVLAAPETPLMIVAGPGSGKTTVLVLRALRLVFIDGLMPENIVITTFTRKAADEIRSRLIEWGLALLEHLGESEARERPREFGEWLETIDINRFVTGTLDSICEDTLTVHRDPGDAPPVLVEGFVGNALLAQQGMFPSGAWNNDPLAAYLAQFTRDGQAPRNFGEMIDICRTVVDRLIQDRVDLRAFSLAEEHTEGRRCIVRSLESYKSFMAQTNRMDFAGLEEVFLDRLAEGRLQRFTSMLRAILVDEYQDTNPLQESIYFELVRQTHASLSVVGDDDQSLYRFRGATVELFCHFADRFAEAVQDAPAAVAHHLIDNYRSSPEIVAFFNDFVNCDPSFAGARVQPPKPNIAPQIASSQIPVLGLFRPNAQTLAHDVASFLTDVFRGEAWTRDVNGRRLRIARDPEGGDFGDAVVLAHTVDELGRRYGDNEPRARLPRLLRQELLSMGDVRVFNPRGQALRDIPEVQILLGLILECIDPPSQSAHTGECQSAAMLRRDARRYLSLWRDAARRFIAENPRPNSPQTLGAFIRAWQSRTNQTSRGDTWPEEWPILELCYKLITWMPFFQDDPEGQVYLEAMSRCVAQAATFSPYRSTIVCRQGVHDARSITRAIMDIMVPLAEEAIEVDEEIMPHIPRNRVPIMTIHQAKGLEFPLVIVDVSSDYTADHWTQRFRRYPEHLTSTQTLEDDVAQYCSIGPLRTARDGLLRTFDDLVRLYYVAYSRAQSLLMLVGIDRCLRYDTTIRHVATGWRYDGSWAWQTPVSGRRPTIANNCPLELI